MYELIQAAGNSYYIDCPAKIGLVRTGEDEVCIIEAAAIRRPAVRSGRFLIRTAGS